ncbi:MAG: hypothetical protein WCA89_02430 [Terracidiphilus sp.]|jgi:hypothetical protein
MGQTERAALLSQTVRRHIEKMQLHRYPRQLRLTVPVSAAMGQEGFSARLFDG